MSEEIKKNVTTPPMFPYLIALLSANEAKKITRQKWKIEKSDEQYVFYTKPGYVIPGRGLSIAVIENGKLVVKPYICDYEDYHADDWIIWG